MHLWWPAFLPVIIPNATSKFNTTAATPSAAVKQCLPGNSRNNMKQHDEGHPKWTYNSIRYISVQVFRFCWRKLKKTPEFCEWTLQLRQLKSVVVAEFSSWLPLSGSWGSRRASASHAPNLAKRARAVAATISWGNPLGTPFHHGQNVSSGYRFMGPYGLIKKIQLLIRLQIMPRVYSIDRSKETMIFSQEQVPINCPLNQFRDISFSWQLQYSDNIASSTWCDHNSSSKCEETWD